MKKFLLVLDILEGKQSVEEGLLRAGYLFGALFTKKEGCLTYIYIYIHK